MQIQMKKYKYIIFSILTLLWVFTACSEFDSIGLGKSFKPYNSLVTKFRQLVYVEYSEGNARVWGPCADRVEASIGEDSQVTIKSDLDSLVVIAYGFAAHDTIRDTKDKTTVIGVVDYHGSLSIESKNPYALYLTNLVLNSSNGTAIHSLGKGDCFLVLTDQSENILKGSCVFEGHLLLDGKGDLTINTTETNALSAKGGLTCSYPVTVHLRSQNGNGLHVEGGELKIADGGWNIQSGTKSILEVDRPVVINAGTCYGIGAKSSQVKFEGNQYACEIPSNLAFMADSIYSGNRMGSQDTVAIEMFRLTPVFDQPNPLVFISNNILLDGDIVTFTKYK